MEDGFEAFISVSKAGTIFNRNVYVDINRDKGLINQSFGLITETKFGTKLNPMTSISWQELISTNMSISNSDLKLSLVFSLQ